MNQAYSFKQKCERSEMALRAFRRKVLDSNDSTPTTSRPATNIVSIETASGRSKFAKQISYLIQDRIIDGDNKPTHQCVNCWATFDTSAEIERHLMDDICVSNSAEKSPSDDIDGDYDIDDTHDSPGADELSELNLTNLTNQNFIAVANQSESKFVCDNCKRPFTSQHSLRAHHKWRKCFEQTFECDICGGTYSTKRNIRRHIHRQHRVQKVRKNAKNTSHEKKYKCDECPKGASE